MVTNHVSKQGSGRGKSDEKVSVVRAGSVTLKIYTLRHGNRVRYTVSWHVGPKRHRKHFSCLQRARAFAKERAEALAAGQVHGPQLTTAQAQDTKEALRRLGAVEMPLHVVAGEYVDLKRTIGERGTLRQAVEFYLHNSIRPDMERTVSQVVEEFTASRRANGCCQLYIDDCRLRLGAFGRAFQMPITHLLTMDMEKWLGRIAGLTSRNDARRLIITMFNWARRRGYLPRDRETEAKWLEKPRIKPKPIVIFTPGEMRELLEASEGQARLGLALGAFTGIRSAELLRLRWENFNWEEVVIDLGVDQDAGPNGCSWSRAAKEVAAWCSRDGPRWRGATRCHYSTRGGGLGCGGACATTARIQQRHLLVPLHDPRLQQNRPPSASVGSRPATAIKSEATRSACEGQATPRRNSTLDKCSVAWKCSDYEQPREQAVGLLERSH